MANAESTFQVRHGRSMTSAIHNYGGQYDERIVHVSPGNVIQVLFRSDSSVALSGFRLEYKAGKQNLLLILHAFSTIYVLQFTPSISRVTL